MTVTYGLQVGGGEVTNVEIDYVARDNEIDEGCF